MDETPRTEPRESSERSGIKMGRQGWLWALLLVVLAFFIGFFWQFYQATTVRATLAATEHELIVERLRVQLANAAIAAQTGRYEASRREMSDFFNRIHAQRAILPQELRSVADEFLAMRDDVITGLSRGNPEYAGVLFGMLDRFEAAAPAQGAARSDTPEGATRGPPPGNQP
jgi:hypothetical protein